MSTRTDAPCCAHLDVQQHRLLAQHKGGLLHDFHRRLELQTTLALQMQFQRRQVNAILGEDGILAQALRRRLHHVR